MQNMAEEVREFSAAELKEFRKVVTPPALCVVLTQRQFSHLCCRPGQNFDLFDKKPTGSIPISDMGTVIRANGQYPTESELQDYCKQVDKNNSGTVEFDEYVNLMARTSKTNETMEDAFYNAFLTFDADGSGFIDREELISILTTLGDAETMKANLVEINSMFDEADTYKDGKINCKATPNPNPNP